MKIFFKYFLFLVIFILVFLLIFFLIFRKNKWVETQFENIKNVDNLTVKLLDVKRGKISFEVYNKIGENILVEPENLYILEKRVNDKWYIVEPKKSYVKQVGIDSNNTYVFPVLLNESSIVFEEDLIKKYGFCLSGHYRILKRVYTRFEEYLFMFSVEFDI